MSLQLKTELGLVGAEQQVAHWDDPINLALAGLILVVSAYGAVRWHMQSEQQAVASEPTEVQQQKRHLHAVNANQKVA
jgi:hypothetical protein